ncbi:MAG TPA: diguanylate cyclase, partial [Dehalococcoidia bacterium]|nr:diguanylate cyclase [Dehalococcoidia bacterium]
TNRVPTHHAVYEAIHRDGRIVKLELHVRNLMGPGGVTGRHGIAHDVTEQAKLLQAAEAERRRTRRALARERRERARVQTLLEVVMAAASTLSVRKILIKVCDAVARLSVADRCSIFLYDEQNGVLQPYMSLGINDPALWQKFLGAAGTPLERVRAFDEALRTRRPYIELRVPGSGAVPDFWADTFELKSLAIYPMIVRDRVVGMMAVDSPYRYVKFPREEIETFAVIAHQAAIIIDNARLFERVEQEARTDFLTGFPNHRHLQDLFEAALQKAASEGQPLGIAMVDMDNFKLLNDVHGHQIGDEVLKRAAAVMRRCVRPQDIVGRYGGDEFLFLLPGANKDEATRIMERVDAAIRAEEVNLPGIDHPIPLRISWGVAAYPQDGSTRRSLIALADAALMERRFHRRASNVSAPSALTTRDFMEMHPETVLLAEGLLQVVDRKDPYTFDHSKQHASLALVLADELGLPERERYALWIGGLLHDIGKIGVPAEILRKPGPLTPAEWEIMRQHVIISENIVRGLFDLEEAAMAVATHHERYDGCGYPRGLRAEDIPRLGRMLAVVDAYSAMVHDRPYRKGMTEEAAIDELRANAGTQFDPELVEAFLRALGRRARRAA